MSTTIDAAIIKALVEHIGMNPDDVGTGSASRGTPIPVSWAISSADGMTFLKFTIPEGKTLQEYLPPGTRLYLNNNQTSYEGMYNNANIDSFIVQYESTNKAILTGTCGTVNVKLCIELNGMDGDGSYAVEETVKEGIVNIPLPDNTTTGFFVPNPSETIGLTICSLVKFVEWKLNNFKHQNIDDLEIEIQNIKKRLSILEGQ